MFIFLYLFEDQEQKELDSFCKWDNMIYDMEL